MKKNLLLLTAIVFGALLITPNLYAQSNPSAYGTHTLAGSDNPYDDENGWVSIAFSDTLARTQAWKITAVTTPDADYNTALDGDVGCTLFAGMKKIGKAFALNYFLGGTKQSTAFAKALIHGNPPNYYGFTTTLNPLPTEITIVIKSDGSGRIYSTASANDTTWRIGTLTDADSIFGIRSRQKSPVTVTIEPITSVFYSDVTSLDYSYAIIGNPGKKTLSITATGLNSEISASLKQNDGFLLESSTIAKEGGTLDITFAPTEAKEYADTLVLTNADAETVEIPLAGIGRSLILSTTGNEYWYTMKVRALSSQECYLTNNGNNIPLTLDLTTDDNKELQYWKFSGTADNCKIVSKNGLEIRWDVTLGRIVASAKGSGDPHQIIPTGQNCWYLQNTSTAGANRNIGCLTPPTAGVECLIKSDVGTTTQILLVDVPGQNVGILAPTADLGEKLYTEYYNIQGVKIHKPAQNGIYIRKDVYRAGTDTKKVYLKVK
ncbi:MAG: hypothetical protein LBR64_01110 [Dysgonamonadaceae bacterium]|jgi:hypothetical protein|nr:hypothetical protein [Dysgonamonadaceae bacterium]